MTEPGTATLVHQDDGTVTVTHADPVIRVALELARDLPHDDGVITLDTAGEYRYRLTGPDPNPHTNALLYERVED